MVDVDDSAIAHIEFDIVDEIIVPVVCDLSDGFVEGLFRGAAELPLLKRSVEKPNAQKGRDEDGSNNEDG